MKLERHDNMTSLPLPLPPVPMGQTASSEHTKHNDGYPDWLDAMAYPTTGYAENSRAGFTNDLPTIRKSPKPAFNAKAYLEEASELAIVGIGIADLLGGPSCRLRLPTL